MKQIFNIKNGQISFETDKVSISDNSKKNNLIMLVSAGIWTIFGTISVLRYFSTGDQFLLWTGLFIGIGHLGFFILSLFRSNQNEILFNDIKSITVKQRFGNRFLDIRLKNNKLRRIIGVENSPELEDYIKSNIENRIH
jgi:hypothetical protein